MPFILPPPPRQNNNIGDAITGSLMAYLAAREQTQERERQRELLQLQKNKAQLEAKHLDHQMKVQEFAQNIEGANNAFKSLQGMPGPANDISNGVSGIAGAPTGPDPWSALEQGPGLAEQIIQGRVPQPMQQPPRMDTSGMQPVGQHPLIQFPVNLNGDTVGVRPQTDTEVMQGKLTEQDLKNRQARNALIETKSIENLFRGQQPRTPQEIAQDERLTKEGELNRENARTVAEINARARKEAAEGSRTSPDDIKLIVQGMKNGTIPPDLQGYYRNKPALLAEAERQGFDLNNANLDWMAVKKHISSLGSVKQSTLRQTVKTARDSLDVIDSLSEKWNTLTSPMGGQLPPLNKVALKTAQTGVLGPEANKLATQLQGQITDVVSELGQVYMGGNSPTDHALKLAEKNLDAGWSLGTLKAMTDLARTNLDIRLHSMATAGVAGLGKESRKPADLSPELSKSRPPAGAWVQENTETGEQRYSTDGGKTWIMLK